MKKTVGLVFVGIAAIVVAGVIIYRKRSRNTTYMLSQVSEEGYETAHDVLFPRKSKRGRNLRYGPVFPYE